jgi:hypothetical protein
MAHREKLYQPPEWVELEEQKSHESYTVFNPHMNQINKNYMDGVLMNALHGNLHKLSEQSYKKLRSYYSTGILTLPEQYSILNEIIGPKAMLLALHLPN